MELSKAQRKELLSELRLERSRRYADRIRVILLLDDGESPSDIARFLFMDEGSIRNYHRRYEEGGIERLVNDHYIGRKAFLTDEQQLVLMLELESKVYPKSLRSWRKEALKIGTVGSSGIPRQSSIFSSDGTEKSDRLAPKSNSDVSIAGRKNKVSRSTKQKVR